MEIGKPSKAFWIIGAAFLLWNGFGCLMYVMDKMMSDAALLDYYKENGQVMLEARHAYPAWATAGYAIAVWGGLLASVLYLMRKKLATTLFVVSLIAAIICFIPSFTNPAVKAGGGDAFWVMPVIVIVLGLFEVWWSRKKVADRSLR